MLALRTRLYYTLKIRYHFSLASATLLTIGSMMLFLGDVEYGMHRFRKPGKLTVGPICYAGGQL